MRLLKDNERFLKVLCWSDWNNRKYYDRAGVYRIDENGFTIKQFPLTNYSPRYKRGEMNILFIAPEDTWSIKKESFIPIIEQISDEIGVPMINFEFNFFNQFMKTVKLVHEVIFHVCFTKRGSTFVDGMGMG